MASLRDIRRRITSVKNTRKITRAMKLVAAAKMRKAQVAAQSAQPYQQSLQTVLGRVVAAEDSIEHPLLAVPSNKLNVVLIALTSDRGLCGSFNSQLIKHTIQLAKKYKAEGKDVQIIAYGRKIVAAMKSEGLDLLHEDSGLKPEQFADKAQELSKMLVSMLEEDRFEKVLLCYNEFINVMTQEAMNKQVLPMDLSDVQDEQSANADYIYEPGGTEILAELLPLNLRAQLLQAFLDTEAGEQAARMQAMENATKNAGEMIDRLSLEYNRARQAAITTELTEIISGAEAL